MHSCAIAHRCTVPLHMTSSLFYSISVTVLISAGMSGCVNDSIVSSNYSVAQCSPTRAERTGRAPDGFTPLFDGRSLSGWKGLVADPPHRAKMSAEALAAAQAKADESMRAHWRVEDGVLKFDGKGESLCTAADYGNFEMLVDWKIEKGGDSGIYLRGSPQVQIWDNPLGSGGLYNNQKNPSNPTSVADKPIGEWNTFRIRMVGEKVTVWLNGTLVVDGVVMENYWERSKPIYPTGQIELQNHSSPLEFRNISIKRLS